MRKLILDLRHFAFCVARSRRRERKRNLIIFKIRKIYIILTEFTKIKRSQLRNVLCYVCSNYASIQKSEFRMLGKSSVLWFIRFLKPIELGI